jgi:ubiquinone/menaquinone biosynthesis C-methylase UbiE
MPIASILPLGLKNQIKGKFQNIIKYSPEVRNLEETTKTIKTELSQLRESLQLYNKINIPPPELLQRRITGGFYDDFISSGYRNLREFEDALNPHGKSVGDFTSVLDFGCGCGRVFMAIHFSHPKVKISGSDIDDEAINYCHNHFSSFGDFRVNPTNGPSLFADNSFDFVYGISVFTHLPEDMQMIWLEDLYRITKENAYLILTVENEKSRAILNEAQEKELNEKGFYYFVGDLTQGLPEFYRTTLHTHDYVKRVWGKYFEILDIRPKGMMNHQDYVVCCRRNNI